MDGDDAGTPSPAFFEGVGRVVVAAAGLDFALALLVFLLTPIDDDVNLWAIASQPGRPLRDARRVTSQLPGSEPFSAIRTLVTEAGVAFAQRNRITHSVLALQSSDGIRTWTAIHPRTLLTSPITNSAEHEPVPTFDVLVGLEGRLQSASVKVLDWINDHSGLAIGWRRVDRSSTEVDGSIGSVDGIRGNAP